MRPPADKDPEPHIVDHAPDEVCVLVRADDAIDPPQMYEEARRAINAALADERGRPQAAASSSDILDRDLELHELRRRFTGDDEILRPLGARAPWVHVPIGEDEANWHFYYAVGTERVDFGQQDERTSRMHRVRELVNLLNRPAAQRARPLATGAGWSVVGGAANWLTVAAQIACGCPASLPTPETRRGRWRFHFAPELERTLDHKADQPAEVVVAILDAWPDQVARRNDQLSEVLNHVQLHPVAHVPPWKNVLRPWWNDLHAIDPDHTPPLPIADHGLFVAGIVHDIAPQAQLHVYRVLDEFGVGDAFGLVKALRSLPDELLRGHPNRRLVVNLSFGATVPALRRRHWSRWLPNSLAARTESYPRPDQAAASLLDASHSSLWRTIEWLRRQNVLVVAAAGNDGLRPQTHDDTPPPPRFPARYEHVFAVAATVGDGSPASYSNRADIQPFGNGITTFGGNVVSGASNDDVPRAQDGAIVGLFGSATLPGGEPNDTGWVRWAGTSFATPIIAGLSARLWSLSADLTPPEVMRRVLDFAHDVPGGTRENPDPDGALDAPMIDARQEFEAM